MRGQYGSMERVDSEFKFRASFFSGEGPNPSRFSSFSAASVYLKMCVSGEPDLLWRHLRLLGRQKLLE